jgi:hypothetical protein
MAYTSKYAQERLSKYGTKAEEKAENKSRYGDGAKQAKKAKKKEVKRANRMDRIDNRQAVKKDKQEARIDRKLARAEMKATKKVIKGTAKNAANQAGGYENTKDANASKASNIRQARTKDKNNTGDFRRSGDNTTKTTIDHSTKNSNNRKSTSATGGQSSQSSQQSSKQMTKAEAAALSRLRAQAIIDQSKKRQEGLARAKRDKRY